MEPKPDAKLTSKQINELRMAICEDLDLLGYLHAREVNKKDFTNLRSTPFANHLGIVLTSERALEALKVIDSALAGVSETSKTDQADKVLEEMACDYAGIYLTHQCGVSPCESPWLDIDHLERQKPMFEVREWYEYYRMKALDWRKRPDDHLATQLVFAAHLLRDPKIELDETAHFLDQHLLKWIGGFAAKVAGRCATPFYAGLSMLTSAYLEELRDMIEAITGLKRPAPEESEEKSSPEDFGEDQETPFAPGTGGPGW